MSTLAGHLAAGVTTVARAWAVARRDGVVMGFTDHDRDLAFEGILFRARSGMTARAMQQTTGLSVDNTEAYGALSDAVITEADVMAGRYDGAEVRVWRVNWADIGQRALEFRGTIGEVTRAGGAFRAELRGLTEALNAPQGRVFQAPCSAVLGDARCRVDLSLPGYAAERKVEAVEAERVFRFAAFAGFDDRWFEGGRLVVLDGRAAGLVGQVKNDRLSAGGARAGAVAAPGTAGGAGRPRPDRGGLRQAARHLPAEVQQRPELPRLPRHPRRGLADGGADALGRREGRRLAAPDRAVRPGAEVVAAARRWIGTPYLHQASLRGAGADCLGLIRGLWRELCGPEPCAVPPYTQDWAEPARDEVLWRAAARHLDQRPPEAEPQPGDVLLFRMRAGGVAKHLGVQAEVGPAASFVHAYSGHGVIESALTPPWARRVVARFQFR